MESPSDIALQILRPRRHLAEAMDTCAWIDRFFRRHLTTNEHHIDLVEPLTMALLNI